MTQQWELTLSRIQKKTYFYFQEWLQHSVLSNVCLQNKQHFCDHKIAKVHLTSVSSILTIVIEQLFLLRSAGTDFTINVFFASLIIHFFLKLVVNNLSRPYLKKQEHLKIAYYSWICLWKAKCDSNTVATSTQHIFHHQLKV